MNQPDVRDDAQERREEILPPAADGEPVPAWEEVEAGRYMPRRVRGSCRGRKLG